MALIVEDGTGLSTAESYASVADADTRHSNLGNTAWAALTTAQKEQSLRKATQYMVQMYRSAWQGRRNTQAQALCFPRYGVVVDGFEIDSDVVPVDVENACIDLALKAYEGELLEDQEQGIVREKIGPIETQYDTASPRNKRFMSVENMLSPYFGIIGNLAVELVRT